MKQTLIKALIDVLDEINASSSQSYEHILDKLEKVGYKIQDIQYAIHWLQGFADAAQDRASNNVNQCSTRIYSPEEKMKLGRKGLNFLLYLENIGIVDSRSREMIIERLMMIDAPGLNTDQIRWIAMMVLANQGTQVPKLSWLHSILSYPGEESATCH